MVGSVANYFAAHGWEKDGPVATRTTPAANARAVEPKGFEPAYPLEQLAEWGYPAADAFDDPTRTATLLALDGADGKEHWITFRNFHVITRYNRSPLYAMAVWQLSREIARGVAGSGR